MTQMDLKSAFDLAVKLFDVEDFQRASILLEDIDAAMPSLPQVLHLLGRSKFNIGAHGDGLELVIQAIRIEPLQVLYLASLIEMLDTASLSMNTEGYYQKAIAALPGVENVAGQNIVPAIIQFLTQSPLNDTYKSWGVLLGRYGDVLFCDESRCSAELLNVCSILLTFDKNVEDEIRLRINFILQFLKYGHNQPMARSQPIYEGLLLPWLKAALRAECFRVAMKLETVIYKAIETEDHFYQSYQDISPLMRNAGGKLGAGLPKLTWPEGDELKIGFFMHTGHRLGHTEVLMSLLKGMHNRGASPFSPTVYIAGMFDQATVDEFRSYGANVVFLSQDQDFFCWDEANVCPLVRLRERLKCDGVTALVWVSLPVWMSLAFSIRVAPVQIWMAMKYHDLYFEEIDGYITGGSLLPYRELNGRLWRNVRAGLNGLFDPSLTAMAHRVRNNFNESLILGCFAREKKLDSRDFLVSVAQLLVAHKNAIFLWTGRKERESIRAIFQEAGVSERARFIGWVDTRLYAQVIDVFLDSFPFPCGLTAMQAMAAGKPVVFYSCHESISNGIVGTVKSVLEESGESQTKRAIEDMLTSREGETLFLCAETPAQYSAFAERLILDEHFRQTVGGAMKRFADTQLSNPEHMADDLTKHIQEIVSEKLGITRSKEIESW